MIRRARFFAVVGIVLAGAITVIGSTRPWLDVLLADGSSAVLPVPGASAVPVLAPLGLAILALGGALSIVGTVLRYLFAALGLGISLALGIPSARIALTTPVDAVVATVTPATGIAGLEAVTQLVDTITATPWPAVTLVAQIVLAAASVFTLVTAHAWRGGSGRRFRSAAAAPASTTAGADRPHDAIDSWDDLSRGDDPTT